MCKASREFVSFNDWNDWNGWNLWNAFASQNRGGVLDRLDDLGVAGAAAEVTGQGKTNLFFARIGIFIEQRLRHHQHARGAVAALGAAVLQEGFLNRMELGADLEPFYGHDLRAIQFAGKHQAGIHRLAVQKNGAGAAVAGAAAFLGAGDADLVAQEIEQETMRGNF